MIVAETRLLQFVSFPGTVVSQGVSSRIVNKAPDASASLTFGWCSAFYRLELHEVIVPVVH